MARALWPQLFLLMLGFSGCFLNRTGGGVAAGERDGGDLADGGRDDASVTPRADSCVPGPELCNGVDDDCDPETPDGAEDAGVGITCDGDDADGCADDLTVCLGGRIQCAAGDDTPETCGGGDEDCDGMVDEASAVDAARWYVNADGDGYGVDGTGFKACQAPPDTASSGGDCDDSNADIHPGAVETCDGVDEDCSGTPDENVCGCPVRVVGSGAYLFCSATPLNWSGAEAACKARGPYRLVTIDEMIENDGLAVAAAELVEGTWWTGLLRSATRWVWASGAPVEYTNWASGEGTGAMSEHCWAMISSLGTELGQWRDLGCVAVRSYICEPVR